MNIEDMIMNGANEEEVLAALKNLKAKKAAKDEAEKKAAAAKKDKAQTEELKAEGRGYLINAIISYSLAFGLVTEDEVDDEMAQELETFILQMEEMVPLYIKMYELEKKFKKDDPFTGFGLGGFKM